MRLEAHESIKTPGVRGLLGGKLKGRVACFTMVDHYDPKSDMSAMMRTTAFPASIVLQMMCSGAVSKHGAVLQERDVPAEAFLEEIARRGIKIEYRSSKESGWTAGCSPNRRGFHPPLCGEITQSCFGREPAIFLGRNTLARTAAGSRPLCSLVNTTKNRYLPCRL